MVREQAQRGDTLIEVLMSVLILSIVIVGSITAMSRGMAQNQIAMQHTQVRFSVTGQSEMLRYLRDGYLQDPQSTAGQTWSSLFTGTNPYANTTTSVYNGTSCAVTTNKQGFYLSLSSGAVTVTQFDSTQKPATVAIPGQGMWIEATRSSGVAPAYVDLQIRACWNGLDGSAQQEVTVLRLYDPAH